jgi:hypothetical protein
MAPHSCRIDEKERRFYARDRREFFTRVKDCGIGSDRYAAINCAACLSASSRKATRTRKQVLP